MRGFVETIAEHEARGWAFDEVQPDNHLAVAAWLDGKLIATAIANLLRQDLHVAGIGKGDHGFLMQFKPVLPPGAISQIEIRVENTHSSVKLDLLEGGNQSKVDDASNSSIPFVDTTQHPVFILGPARSGTSAIALSLLKSGQYQGHGEGHLLPLAHQLLRVVDAYYRVHQVLDNTDSLLRSVHYGAFQRLVRRGFVQLLRASYPTGYWIDKTPTAAMVRAAPLLKEIWPNARFIFLKRRVIENIISRRRKFPHDTLENHYLDWVDVFSAWQDVKGFLGQNAFEVDQLQMARHNDEVAGQISDFLGMPYDQAHIFRQTLASDHPEQTSNRVGISASLDSLDLSPDAMRELRIACDPIMDVYGYSYGEEYYAKAE